MSKAPPRLSFLTSRPSHPQDPREVDRQKRRERNRAAAQRSRHKHTEKADGLHQEHEWLEKANQVLRKEIWSLESSLLARLRPLSAPRFLRPAAGCGPAFAATLAVVLRVFSLPRCRTGGKEAGPRALRPPPGSGPVQALTARLVPGTESAPAFGGSPGNGATSSGPAGPRAGTERESPEGPREVGAGEDAQG
uniref:BZIP domain-containing protein n=1 Tax=Sarcophilus harrisii TaxID=9305 RepID=A0A7N4PG78_SARHA